MTAVLESDVLKNWKDSLRAPDTREHYSYHLSLFCRFHNTTPEKLLRSRLDVNKDRVLKYILHLKAVARPSSGKGPRGSISVNSIPTYLNGIQNFYTFYEKQINWKKYRKMMPEKVKSDLRSYSREEIQSLLMHADLRDSVIILLMVAAGPRVGALPELKFKHITAIESNVGMIKLYPESARSHYVSLLTPEAMSAVGNYRQWRIDHGEKSLNEESWLIRNKFSEFGKSRNKPEPITKQAIYVTIRRLMDKANIKDPRLQPDHSFRYFFDTAVMNSDVKHEFKELFMGHSVGLDDYYYDAKTTESQQKIFGEYWKTVDALTIDPKHRLQKELLQKKVELQKKDELIGKYEGISAEFKDLVRGYGEQQKEIEELKTRLGEKRG